MAAHGLEMPSPLPENRNAWTSFLRVQQYRHAPMGHPWLPNWSDIAPVLELYGQWTLAVHAKLVVCFNELLTLEDEQRKAING